MRNPDGTPKAPYDNGAPYREATQYWVGPAHGTGMRDGVMVADGSWQNAADGPGTADDLGDVVVGSPGSKKFMDNLTGRPTNDIFCGRGGADQILGGNGHDVIWGVRNGGEDPADCIVHGVAWVAGFYKNIDGETGSDFIVGGRCADFIDGDNDADIIDDHGGSDRILGQSGNDKINGDNGNDDITGDEGDDEINGGPGADLICGGPANDVIVGDHPSRGPNGNDLIDQGGFCRQGQDVNIGTWRNSLGVDSDRCSADGASAIDNAVNGVYPPASYSGGDLIGAPGAISTCEIIS